MHMPLLLASIVIWRDICHFVFDEASFRRPITRAASLCSQALLAMGAHFTCLHASVDAASFLSRYTCTRLLVRRSRGISFSAQHSRGLRSQAWPYFHRGLTQPPGSLICSLACISRRCSLFSAYFHTHTATSSPITCHQSVGPSLARLVLPG